MTVTRNPLAAPSPSAPPPPVSPPISPPPVPPPSTAPTAAVPPDVLPPDGSADPPTVELPALRMPVAALVPVVGRPRAGRVRTPGSRRWQARALALACGLLLLAGAVTAVLLGTGPAQETRSGGGPAGHDAAVTAFPVTGTVTLVDAVSLGSSISSSGGPGGAAPAGACTGTGDYADVRAGAVVTVASAAGVVVATAPLGPGLGRPGVCTFPFTVPAVPVGSSFYLVEVGHRGAVTYNASDLRTRAAALRVG